MMWYWTLCLDQKQNLTVPENDSLWTGGNLAKNFFRTSSKDFFNRRASYNLLFPLPQSDSQIFCEKASLLFFLISRLLEAVPERVKSSIRFKFEELYRDEPRRKISKRSS
uniref:Uncharacterized protein n=1 Tax=Ditylenchus dipsaci TaxID=166011 RepID=A0A915D6G6_9BILA